MTAVKFARFCLQQEYMIEAYLTSILHSSVELKWKQTHIFRHNFKF